jgi:hypothetical protein
MTSQFKKLMNKPSIFSLWQRNPHKARSQTVNTVGVAASSAGAYMYIRLYTYLVLYCTLTVYMYIGHIYYVCISVKSADPSGRTV